jgi:beta-xylosidase
MVAVPPAFFSTIAAILQAAHPSQIIIGAIEEASALAYFKPQLSLLSSTFTSVTGPVIKRNFPDPSAIKVEHVWHAFATNDVNGGPHVQVAVSNDFESWTYLEKDALPTVGPWSNGVGIWAPDVVQLVRVSLIYTTPGGHHDPKADLDPIQNNGSFVLYYSATVASSPAQHCVGVATSSNVEGPYISTSTPFACPLSIGGAIDADGFLDPSTGKRYVVYKVDGNSLGHGGACKNGVQPLLPTPIHLQEVQEDGITPIGDPVTILDRIDSDGPLVEAPSLHISPEGIYFLFFSSNCYTTTHYDVKYATATNVTGPYTRAAGALLSTGDGPNLVGPGGADVAGDPGGCMVFHADIGSSDGKLRGMYTARPKFEGRKVTL